MRYEVILVLQEQGGVASFCEFTWSRDTRVLGEHLDFLAFKSPIWVLLRL